MLYYNINCAGNISLDLLDWKTSLLSNQNEEGMPFYTGYNTNK